MRELYEGAATCWSRFLHQPNKCHREIFSSAQQMQNFVYLVGDAKTREAVVVDAAWDVKVSVLLTEGIGEWCHNALDH
jgi:hypothetical protein